MKSRYLVLLGLAGSAAYDASSPAEPTQAEPTRAAQLAAVADVTPHAQAALETRPHIRSAEVPQLPVNAPAEAPPVEIDEDHGAIQGVLTDAATGDKLAGVAVTVTSPELDLEETVITEEDGAYRFHALPAGDYTVTFHDADVTVVRAGVAVRGLETSPVFQKIDTTARDPYIKTIPVPGRTFAAVLGEASGSQGETMGVPLSSNCGVENTYIVDGE